MQCKNILIVEDDEDIREALRLTLEMENYKVLTAANGKMGLEALAKIETPCLVLLDLMMPIMDGWSFAEAISKDMALAAIPIVVVPAFSDKTLTQNGVRRVIKKPVEIDLLLQLVKQYCS